MLLSIVVKAQDDGAQSVSKDSPYANSSLSEPQLLKSAVVSAKTPPVTVLEDTLVYNPAAYRLEEDAMLEDLLKKIPGLEIKGRTVTLHGKPIQDILVNGERFFGGDVAAGLKTLPADMVDKLHAFERESEFTRTTGIDDGEKEPVLDVKIKKSMFDKWQARAALGGGSDLTPAPKYGADFSANKITKRDQTSLILSVKNTNTQPSFSNTSSNVIGGGSAGDRTAYEAGFTIVRKRRKLQMDGNVHLDGTFRLVQPRASTQNIYASGGSWTNSNGFNRYASMTPKADFRFEWRPDPYLNILLRPSVRFVSNDNSTQSIAGNFFKDPYTIVDDPNDYLEIGPSSDTLAKIRSNSSVNSTRSFVNRFNARVQFQITKRFKEKKGRSLSFSGIAEYTPVSSESFNDYLTRYYRYKANPDSVLLRKQYISTPTQNLHLRGQIGWNEPLGKGFFIQAFCNFNYRNSTYNRSYYNLMSVDPTWSVDNNLGYNALVASLPAGYQQGYEPELCAVGSYDFYSAEFNLNMRYVRKKFNLTAGACLTPAWSQLYYDNSVVKNNAFMVTPNFTLNYRWKKTNKITATYRSRYQQPSLYQLLPVENGTNPLYVHVGNADLKPAFVHDAKLSLNSSDLKTQNSVILELSFKYTQDAVSNYYEYDAQSGVKTTIPVNVDGVWLARGSLVWNKTFRNNDFSICNTTNGEMANNVAWLYNNKTKVSEINNARRAMVKERFDFIYRNNWLELVTRLTAIYTNETSQLRPDLNQEPLDLSAGLESRFALPAGIRINAEFTFMNQSGYAYGNFNRNYYVLNASVSKTLLNKRLVLKLEGFDLLGQLINLTRTYGSESRTITTYNGANRYVMLRCIYRFKK